MMDRFDGRVAIVTGAAQGIGRAIAERLAQERATVAVVDINDAGAKDAAKAIGGKAFAVACDIGDPASVTALHKAVIDKAGKVDVTVNAAAIVPFVPWDQLTFEEWRRVMRVNLDGLYLMCRASSDLMRKNGYGRIVNICSNSIFAGTPNMAHYVASKGGLEALMRALAVELGRKGIAANAIAPGFFLTDGNAPFFSQPRVAELARRIPLQRFGQPDELVGAAIFLASDAASYITGQVLTVDAGLSIAL